MLSAPVSRQTGVWVMEKLRQKIRKYTLQPDLLHFRVSVKGWHLQHYFAEVFLQNGLREGWHSFFLDYTPFLLYKMVTLQIQSWDLNSTLISLKDLTIIFQFQSTLHEQIPTASLKWYDCLLWILLEICLYRTIGLKGFWIFLSVHNKCQSDR